MMTTFLGSLTFLLLFRPKDSHSFQPVIVTSKINSYAEQSCTLSSRSPTRRIDLSMTSLGMSNSDSETQIVSIPFDGSDDRFDRWKFFQALLEGDHPSSDVVNIVLYRVLEGVLKYSRPSGGRDTQDSEDTIEMTAQVKEKIEGILADYSAEGRVKAVMTMSNDNNDEDYEKAEKEVLAILEQLEGILPDPVEDEEDFKSLWDTIIELHGREAVKFNQSQNPVPLDWKIANTVSRVLLHYDFLTHGIIDAPL
jgi:hypothetical protein